MDKPRIYDVNINDMILSIKDKRQKELLSRFVAEHQGEKNEIRIVSEHRDYFEIIVIHPPEDGFTGGAEQYFLDKNTGKVKMGWHEHPMEIR